MKKMGRSTVIAGILLALVTGALYTTAQDQGGRRGNFDPEQMRARMMENIQTQLAASDDEWKVIEPLVTKVMEKQRAARSGMMGGPGMMMGGPGGPGGPGGSNRAQGNRPQSAQGGQGGPGGPGGPGFRGEPDPDMEALQTVLQSETSTADEIKAKLSAFRTSRDKKAAELKTAREELRKVLSIRQEAQLVMTGMLD